MPNSGTRETANNSVEAVLVTNYFGCFLIIESPITTNTLVLPAFPLPRLLAGLFYWLSGRAVYTRVAISETDTLALSPNLAILLGSAETGVAFLFLEPFLLPSNYINPATCLLLLIHFSTLHIYPTNCMLSEQSAPESCILLFQISNVSSRWATCSHLPQRYSTWNSCSSRTYIW